MISAVRPASQSAADRREGRRGAPRPAALELAKRVLAIEAEAVRSLAARIDQRFLDALDLILACRGRVVVSGIGKSGHIARKIASTMASTGTPAFFVHPAEASHGDLGMVTREDVFIALSNSGESAELLAIVPQIKREGAKLISITGDQDSTLAREADASCARRRRPPLNLAPTASTPPPTPLDALAVALPTHRFARRFARYPAARSAAPLTRISDVMRQGARSRRYRKRRAWPKRCGR